MLVADGMTVYRYAKDRPGETTCYGYCAEDWPPILVTKAPGSSATLPGQFGMVRRTDGTQQLTYNDVPLYLYIEDAPGTDQTNGDGVDGEWYVVHP